MREDKNEQDDGVDFLENQLKQMIKRKVCMEVAKIDSDSRQLLMQQSSTEMNSGADFVYSNMRIVDGGTTNSGSLIQGDDQRPVSALLTQP